MKKKDETKHPKPIKPFKTFEEEAHFWDTHDISLLFKEPQTPLAKLSLIEQEKDEILTIRIQKTVKEDIAKIARYKGVNVTTLARIWLIERLYNYKR